MGLNACELEIDLFCRRLRLSPAAAREAQRVRRTRAGLGSGLELVLPTHSRLKPAIWMNAPIVESFAQTSPYVLHRPAGGDIIVDERTGVRYPVRVRIRPNGTRGKRRVVRQWRGSACCRARTSVST